MTRAASTRDPYYDGIRAVAIGTVIAFHWLTDYVPFFDGGYIGVDIFFVLSGFIITRILWGRTPEGTVGAMYARFLRDRVRRLYPALIGLVIVGIGLEAVFDVPVGPGTTALEGLLSLAQTASFTNGLQISSLDLFSHTWSLSVEWCFYLLWPLALILARGRGVDPRRLARWALTVALPLYVGSLFTGAHWFYYGPTSRASQLLVGCALALWSLGERPPSRWSTRTVDITAGLAVVFIGAWAVFGALQLSWTYRLVGFPLVTLAAALLCAVPLVAPDARVRRLLGLRPLALLGRVSYSLYLFHLLGIEVLDKNRLDVAPVLLGAGAVAGTVVLTALSYRFLERPFTSSRTGSLGITAAVPDGVVPQDRARL